MIGMSIAAAYAIPTHDVYTLLPGVTTPSIPFNWNMPRDWSSGTTAYLNEYKWIAPTGIDSRRMRVHVNERGELITLRPIMVRNFAIQDRTLCFKQPLELEPDYDPESMFFTLKNDFLGIDVYAESCDELREELLSELAFLWQAYAQGDANNMTSRAIQLKNNLLSSILC